MNNTMNRAMDKAMNKAMDNDANSKPCLCDEDQKELENMMENAKNFPEDVRKVMVLSILQDLLDDKIKRAKERYFDAKKQLDDKAEKITDDEAKKQFKEDAPLLLDVFVKIINDLLVRWNAFNAVIKSEYK